MIKNLNTLIKVTNELSLRLLGKNLWNNFTAAWLKYLLVTRKKVNTKIPTISLGVSSAKVIYQFSNTL